MPAGPSSGAREAPRPPELTRDNAEAPGLDPDEMHRSMQESVMQALKELVTNDVGRDECGRHRLQLGHGGVLRELLHAPYARGRGARTTLKDAGRAGPAGRFGGLRRRQNLRV